MKKYVPDVGINEPARKTGGIKKSVATAETKDPVHEVGLMRKSVATAEVNEPSATTTGIDKAEIPVLGSSVQHIGGWKGLNKRATFDSGALSEAVNVTFKDFPNVESCKAVEKVIDFEMVEKLILEDGSITSIVKPLGEVYDAITRGDEIFIAAEEGYVYGRMVENKLLYIAMCEDILEKPNTKKLLPTEKTRCVFVENYDDEIALATVNKNVCVFSTWGIKHGGEKWLPVFPSGSVEFIKDAFLPLVWKGEADTSRIYCICDETGKAVQVWRYITNVETYQASDVTKDCWVELRRNVYVNMSAEKMFVGYYPDDYAANVYQEQWDTVENTEHVGIRLARITNSTAQLPDHSNKIDIEDAVSYLEEVKLSDWGGNEERDNILGLVHYWEGKGVKTPDDDCSYTKKPGIFNYEKTVAPEFDCVTFYKGRVFGSVGSKVIASMHNSYNEWELDTATDIASDNAWATTTTANTNADGDIVAMREYLGKINVLKTGFMQEVYGGSNPFTIQDVYAVGTPFRNSVCEAYGRLCFAGKNAIRTYGGSFPRIIGDELGIDTYEDVQMLGDDRSVIVRSGGKVYKYDFLLGMWEERKSDYFADVGKMVLLSGDMYAVTNSGELVKLDGTSYGEWSFATDAMTENTLSLKRLQKVRFTYELGTGSEFSMFVVMSDGREVETVVRQNTEKKTVLQRCEFSLTNAVDWFLKLKFTGSGYFKLISLDVEIKNGSTTMYE